MFYQSWQYYWKGAIICVLGNHDVWNYEDKKQNREEHLSIEAVAKQIEQSFEESLFSNTRILLENALYLKLQDSAWGASWNTKGTRLSEEQIIEASVDELKAYFKKASVVVLGGLGFSGKNETFNASNGIYNYALTRPEDIERSSRFEKIYNKMKQCAADVPVIVLTHTPMHDWSGQQYHPGWIYISGHTHQNFRSLDWNGAIRLEDNQLGYQAKDVKLKKFVLNHETYDPLVELPDGIHTISKVEYLDYNQAHKIVIPRFGHNGEIIALKKNLWYMFLLRKNGYLYILDGAKTRVVHKDIRFYYDNLEGYCKCIMKIFGPFCQYEQQIAELVKQTGGAGKIHGCIIDFDFYNHVFVNPLDGSLVPYIALSKTYKSVYTNFMELRNNPQFGSSALGLSEKGGEPLTAIELTAVNKLEQYKCKSEPAGDSIVYDTTIYKYSGIVKSIQYIIDKHIVRVWRDEFLKYTGADSLKGSLNSIPAAEIESYFEESEKEEKYVLSESELQKLHGCRILLAEDNALNTEIAVEIMKKFGIVCDCVTNGKKCLELLTEKPDGYYDAVLMDIQMPVMNGYETTDAIRKMEGKKAEIPVIALTANAFEEDRKKAIVNGMNDHIAKPIDPSILAMTLLKYI